MKGSDRAGLQIVPFNPSDYSLGEVLVRKDTAPIEDQAMVSAALSLYFQWEKHRDAWIYPEGAVSGEGIPCQMDYDRDLRVPTELWISPVFDRRFPSVAPFTPARVAFQVFGVCYEFSCQIRALVPRGDQETPLVVTTVPERMQVYRSRQVPRLDISSLPITERRECRWEPLEEGKSITFRLSEIGLKSLATKLDQEIPKGKGNLCFGEVKIPGELVRINRGKHIFQLSFETGEQAGRYFDIYRIYAYPDLRTRHDLPYEAGFALYRETGYFSKFSPEKAQKESEELFAVWREGKEGFHQTTADYYIVDESGRPTGCSSAVHAFYRGERPIWAFHQLCALKRPDLLHSSGQLYAWRAEYLAARPEELDVVVWFDSRSRWLERIYVKFAAHSTDKNTKLYPITARFCTFTSETKAQINQSTPEEKNAVSALELYSLRIGKLERLVSKREDFLVGVNPRLLNAAGHLNGIISLWDKVSYESIVEIGKVVQDRSGASELGVRVTVGYETDVESLPGETQISDRMMYIGKNELANFLSSISHSVAVMERKSAG